MSKSLHGQHSRGVPDIVTMLLASVLTSCLFPSLCVSVYSLYPLTSVPLISLPLQPTTSTRARPDKKAEGNLAAKIVPWSLLYARKEKTNCVPPTADVSSAQKQIEGQLSYKVDIFCRWKLVIAA